MVGSGEDARANPRRSLVPMPDPESADPEEGVENSERPVESSGADGVAELRMLFESLDKDSDGTVSGKEWGKKVKENQALLGKYFGGIRFIKSSASSVVEGCER